MSSRHYEKIGVILAGVVLVASLIGLLVLIKALSPTLWSEQAAGWVQAIGSLLAIWGAVWIARNQHVQQRLFETERRHLDEIRRFEIVKAILAKAHATAELVAEDRGNSNVAASNPQALRFLRDCKHSFSVLAPFDIPHPDLFIYCSASERAIEELLQRLEREYEMRFGPVAKFDQALSDSIDAAFDEVIRCTKDAYEICQNQVRLRGG